MNTKLISNKALSVIDQYENFKVGKATCSIPYFNNKYSGGRAALRVLSGKGSPKEIFEEVEQICIKNRIDINQVTNESLKKLLVDSGIGIDCSGFAYYVLNAFSESLGKGALDKHISFPLSKGLIGKLRSKIRPVENTGVDTLAHDKNSHVINLKDVMVGDMITMLKNNSSGERNHIIIIYQIEYQNFSPTKIHYVHSIAWPIDGEYGHGIHKGVIEVIDLNKDITLQNWIENNKSGSENYTLERALGSITTLRRLNFLN